VLLLQFHLGSTSAEMRQEEQSLEYTKQRRKFYRR
jgi:hypothetical protein